MLKILEIDENNYNNIYIISDIHSCGTLFEKCLKKLNYDKRDLFIILGDSFDRGKEIEKTLNLILKLKKESNLIHLMGNHEKMLENYLLFDEELPYTLEANGAKETLEYINKNEENREKIEEFLEELPYIVTSQHYIFVHAGIDLEKSLEEQSEKDLLWNRDNFWEKNTLENKTIFFGHIIQKYGIIKEYKNNNAIGIDCGSYKFNRIGCYEVKSKKIFYVGED